MLEMISRSSFTWAIVVPTSRANNGGLKSAILAKTRQSSSFSSSLLQHY